ncbi:hypothetical protein WA158_003227 [Blastocystis sp. Blastoise]
MTGFLQSLKSKTNVVNLFCDCCSFGWYYTFSISKTIKCLLSDLIDHFSLPIDEADIMFLSIQYQDTCLNMENTINYYGLQNDDIPSCFLSMNNNSYSDENPCLIPKEPSEFFKNNIDCNFEQDSSLLSPLTINYTENKNMTCIDEYYALASPIDSISLSPSPYGSIQTSPCFPGESIYDESCILSLSFQNSFIDRQYIIPSSIQIAYSSMRLLSINLSSSNKIYSSSSSLSSLLFTCLNTCYTRESPVWCLSEDIFEKSLTSHVTGQSTSLLFAIYYDTIIVSGIIYSIPLHTTSQKDYIYTFTNPSKYSGKILLSYYNSKTFEEIASEMYDNRDSVVICVEQYPLICL